MHFRQFIVVATIVMWSLLPVYSQEVNRHAVSESAIREAVQAYVVAFNQGDAQALAALWAPEAVYLNPVNGEEVVGREAIQQQFAAIFAEAKDAKLECKTESIGFVSPNVAVEQGSAVVIRPGQEPEESQYSAVYVKLEGKWLLDRVTEADVPEVISHYRHLQELEWMVGSWVDQHEAATVITECSWTRNNNFLTRSFTVQVGEQIDLAGMQIIGWDPADKQIRSWVFDSDGGFGHGTWTKNGNRWHVHQSGVSPDGSRSTAVNIITFVNDNTCTLQSVNRTLDGELLPNIAEVQISKQ